MSCHHVNTVPPRRFAILILVLALSAAMLLAGCAGVRSPEPAPEIQTSDSADPATPDRLEIPSIDVNIPVVKLGWHAVKASEDAIFSEWDVAEYAAGWHKNSALPGESGNVVMSGHNNILGSVFRELDLMREGDETIIWRDGKRYVYTVDRVLVVPEKYASSEQRADNAKWIGEFDDERLTLVSCWPRNNNTHRIIVVARPVRSADTVQATDP
jgi:sortase A